MRRLELKNESFDVDDKVLTHRDFKLYTYYYIYIHKHDMFTCMLEVDFRGRWRPLGGSHLYATGETISIRVFRSFISLI